MPKNKKTSPLFDSYVPPSYFSASSQLGKGLQDQNRNKFRKIDASSQERNQQEALETWKKDRGVHSSERKIPRRKLLSASSQATHGTQLKPYTGHQGRNLISTRKSLKSTITSRISYTKSSKSSSNINCFSTLNSQKPSDSKSIGSLLKNLSVSSDFTTGNNVVRCKDGSSCLFSENELEELKFHLSPESIEDFLNSNEYKEWKTSVLQNSMFSVGTVMQNEKRSQVKTSRPLIVHFYVLQILFSPRE